MQASALILKTMTKPAGLSGAAVLGADSNASDSVFKFKTPTWCGECAQGYKWPRLHLAVPGPTSETSLLLSPPLKPFYCAHIALSTPLPSLRKEEKGLLMISSWPLRGSDTHFLWSQSHNLCSVWQCFAQRTTEYLTAAWLTEGWRWHLHFPWGFTDLIFFFSLS